MTVNFHTNIGTEVRVTQQTISGTEEQFVTVDLTEVSSWGSNDKIVLFFGGLDDVQGFANKLNQQILDIREGN